MSEPRAYRLTDPAEHARLYREAAGYLRTCLDEHHGTDFKGRRFAYEALIALAMASNELAREAAFGLVDWDWSEVKGGDS